MTNLELLKLRAAHANNDRQHDRMVRDKLRSFHRALLYSYQTGWVKKDNDTEETEWCRALINPDKVKFDYDEKIISIDFKHQFASGTTFEWPKDSGIHWIIYKQELTELAYFRGNCRRCQELEATDPETGETHRLFSAVRGPVETKIDVLQKHNLAAQIPSATLDMYMPMTPENLRMFARRAHFKFAGRTWEVQQPDDISTPGILEITATESYDCDYEGFAVERVDPNPPQAEGKIIIEGDTFIQPLTEVTYTATESIVEYEWTVSLNGENKDVEDVVEWTIDKNKIIVCWLATISGSFTITYGPCSKTIVVESLF